MDSKEFLFFIFWWVGNCVCGWWLASFYLLCWSTGPHILFSLLRTLPHWNQSRKKWHTLNDKRQLVNRTVSWAIKHLLTELFFRKKKKRFSLTCLLCRVHTPEHCDSAKPKPISHDICSRSLIFNFPKSVSEKWDSKGNKKYSRECAKLPFLRQGYYRDKYFFLDFPVLKRFWPGVLNERHWSWWTQWLALSLSCQAARIFCYLSRELILWLIIFFWWGEMKYKTKNIFV